MLLGTHILAGASLYYVFKRTKSWIRWPIVAVGGFASHYILDSVITYHCVYGRAFWPWDNHWWPWYNVAFIAVQVLGILALACINGTRARTLKTAALPPALFAGMWAWLSWDWERIIGSNYIHFASWAPRYFAEGSKNPWTGLWEVGFIVGMLLVILHMSKSNAG